MPETTAQSEQIQTVEDSATPVQIDLEKSVPTAPVTVERFGITLEIKIPTTKPYAINASVMERLFEAWLIGANDEEACTHAGIYPASLYTFQRDNKEFLEYKEHLKRHPVLKARFALYKHLDDPVYAWKFLQKKAVDLQDDPKAGTNVRVNVQLNQLVEEDRKRA